MKKCIKCGCDIEYGINGCMIMPDCFDCHGGYPKYPAPSTRRFGDGFSWDESDFLESRCLRSDED